MNNEEYVELRTTPDFQVNPPATPDDDLVRKTASAVYSMFSNHLYTKGGWLRAVAEGRINGVGVVIVMTTVPLTERELQLIPEEFNGVPLTVVETGEL